DSASGISIRRRPRNRFYRQTPQKPQKLSSGKLHKCFLIPLSPPLYPPPSSTPSASLSSSLLPPHPFSPNTTDESKNATTVFRDKSGKKRDLRQERIEHRKKQNEMAATAEKYAQWGKGLAQGEQQKRNTEAALHEMQKPLTRHADDEDLERMLRERERDGDPMAGLLRRKKEKEAKNRNEKPRYSGPMPPPNRFNIYPGYRWDGVDR
uniref:BUD13 homolog n=1 Tax=Callorhinchus milii TaxID=7868 RepID=A0A4W3GDC0_CALMI